MARSRTLAFKVVTPITPRALRERIVELALEDGRTPRFIARRKTPLDRRLSDEEASALERFAQAEALAYAPRASQYEMARVQYGHTGRIPFNERTRREMRLLAQIKRGMPADMRPIADIFCCQMNTTTDAPDAEEAATRLGLSSARQYFNAVVALAKHLTREYDQVKF